MLMKSPLSLAHVAILSCVVLGPSACGAPSPASDVQDDLEESVKSGTVLTCDELQVSSGGIGSGQSAKTLAKKELSGTKDRWTNYVEFDPGSVATCSFALPAGLTVNSLQGVTLRTNYRGPKKSYAPWYFEVWNANGGKWVKVGDNGFAKDWVWTRHSMPFPISAQDTVDGGRIRVRYRDGSTRDEASLLDELVLIAHVDEGSAGTGGAPGTGGSGGAGGSAGTGVSGGAGGAAGTGGSGGSGGTAGAGGSGGTAGAGGSGGTVAWSDVPLNKQITGVQPMTGIVLWADSWNSHAVKKTPGVVQLEYSYVAPNSIVTGANNYDWSEFDALLDSVASRRHQAIIRFYYVYPGHTTGVPDYIKQLGGYSETKGSSEGQTTWFPDWSHAELRSFHKQFMTAVANRYDNDPRLAFLQAGFGLWGEYHIYDGPNQLGEQFPSKSYQTEYLNHMAQTFDRLHWSLSIDAGSDEYSPLPNDTGLRSLGFGLFDDSFMHEEHDQYNEDMWKVLEYQTRYGQAPHGGELSYYSDYDQENALDAGGMYGRTYEQLSAKFHITYMIGNDQPEYQSVLRIRQAGMANGYKFEVLSFQTSSNASRVRIRNSGIAPIYYDAYPSVNGVRATESLRQLDPGEDAMFEIASGGGTPELTIESDRLVAGQTIEFEAEL
jgi:N-terminal glycosyl-hydrolase-114-associated domain